MEELVRPRRQPADPAKHGESERAGSGSRREQHQVRRRRPGGHRPKWVGYRETTSTQRHPRYFWFRSARVRSTVPVGDEHSVTATAGLLTRRGLQSRARLGSRTPRGPSSAPAYQTSTRRSTLLLDQRERADPAAWQRRPVFGLTTRAERLVVRRTTARLENGDDHSRAEHVIATDRVRKFALLLR